MEAAIITTYRCNFKCHMCHIWKNPTLKHEEFQAGLLEKLPRLSFCNITGGEPFIREDIDDIVSILMKKAGRIVISTNGYFTEKIVRLADRYKTIGIRVSLEGLAEINDELRGKKNSFANGLETLRELQKIGLRDIGFGITVSDQNAEDMLELYRLAKSMNLEFATAVVHNSYYFHKYNNRIANPRTVIRSFEKLMVDLLHSKRIKNWFRAYFNFGLINYVSGNPRLLPCRAGEDLFFLDPWGEIFPCNGMKKKYWFESMGNLKEKSFKEIWASEQAKMVRKKVKKCPKNCWMIGTAGPAMKKNLLKPAVWIIKNIWLDHFG